MTYNLPYYYRQGYEWDLSQALYNALNMWLEYKEEGGYPIRNAQIVEMILKRLNDCCTNDSQKVTLIENAIAGNFASIKYETPRENGAKQSTSKRTGHDISAIDNAADEVLRQYQMRYADRGNNE